MARTMRAGPRTIIVWVAPARPIPSALPSTSWRVDAALIEQLHDPARLLGDDALGDPHAVDHDRDEDEEPEDGTDDEPAGECRGVERLGPAVVVAEGPEDLDVRLLEARHRIPRRVVEDGDAEYPDGQVRDLLLAHRLAEVEAESELPGWAPDSNDRGIDLAIPHLGERLLFVGHDDELEAAA